MTKWPIQKQTFRTAQDTEKQDVTDIHNNVTLCFMDFSKKKFIY